MILYSHAEPAVTVVDGAPVGPNGRLWGVFPEDVGKKGVKVPDEAGKYILNHLGYTGVVRVEEIETEAGVKYDLEKAKKESQTKLEEYDKKRFEQWISDMVEDRLNHKKPVPTPTEPMMKIMARRGYDPKKFGITPIGWEEPESRVAQLEKEKTDMQKQLDDLNIKLTLLLEQQAATTAASLKVKNA
jgi:hypothetical protein